MVFYTDDADNTSGSKLTQIWLIRCISKYTGLVVEISIGLHFSMIIGAMSTHQLKIFVFCLGRVVLGGALHILSLYERYTQQNVQNSLQQKAFKCQKLV